MSDRYDDRQATEGFMEIQRLESHIESVESYVATALHGFVKDPPDSDFQSGYLAALKAVATEAMGVTLSAEVERTDKIHVPPVLRIVE